MTLDEGAGREVDDLRLGDGGVEEEVEVLEGAIALEAGAAEALVELPAVAAFGLVVEQAIEELAVADAVVDGLAGAQVERLEHARQA